MKIKVIKSEQEFYSLKSTWNNLLKNSSNNNLFLTWEWLYTWWALYKNKNELFIIIVEVKDKIIGIAPLYLSTKKKFGISFKYLRLLGDIEICSENLDFIIHKDWITKIETHLVEFILKNGFNYDILIFNDFCEKSVINNLIKKYARKHKRKIFCSHSTTNPYISLPSTWEKYFNNLSKNRRKSFRRSYNKLNQSFDLRFSPFATQLEINLKQAMMLMMDLHEMRWKNEKGMGVFKRNTFKEFHSKIARLFYKNGWLGLYFLFLDNKAVAVEYAFLYNKKTYSYQAGFDPNYEKFSVGYIANMLLVKQSIENNYDEFDFLRGDAKYKEKFKTSIRNNVKIVCAKTNIKGKLVYQYHLIYPKIKSGIKKICPNSIWYYLSDYKYKRTMS